MGILTPLNIESLRKDFPILKQQVNGKNLVYLDNGATSQKPQVVVGALSRYYEVYNANVHRGVHHLSQLATQAQEDARKIVAQHINAAFSHEIIFTKGTTDGINLVAFSFGEMLEAGDEIIISAMEHHSNIVPWQLLCERKKCVLKVIPISQSGELEMDTFRALLSAKTKLVSITHVSNALGTVNPIHEVIQLAHQVGAKVLIDGAQSIQHFVIDVQAMDCDFFVFSGHKVFGPTGIGALYGKETLLNKLVPYQGGGDMIEKVSFEKTTYAALPFKFEAGTPHIAGAIGLGAALQYFGSLPLAEVQAHEANLLRYASEEISKLKGVRIIGTAQEKASVLSFVVDGVHPYDIGTLLDKLGFAVRTGHHCTQPIMDFYQIPGTVRASFAFYNTMEEVHIFASALHRVINMLK